MSLLLSSPLPRLRVAHSTYCVAVVNLFVSPDRRVASALVCGCGLYSCALLSSSVLLCILLDILCASLLASLVLCLLFFSVCWSVLLCVFVEGISYLLSSVSPVLVCVVVCCVLWSVLCVLLVFSSWPSPGFPGCIVLQERQMVRATCALLRACERFASNVSLASMRELNPRPIACATSHKEDVMKTVRPLACPSWLLWLRSRSPSGSLSCANALSSAQPIHTYRPMPIDAHTRSQRLSQNA